MPQADEAAHQINCMDDDSQAVCEHGERQENKRGKSYIITKA